MSKMLKLKNNPTLIYPSYADLDPISTRSYYSNQWLEINNQILITWIELKKSAWYVIINENKKYECSTDSHLKQADAT